MIGPNANSRAALVGNYHGTATEYITPLDGILRSAGEEIRVTADALQIDPVLAATFLAVPAALILMLTVLILIIRRR